MRKLSTHIKRNLETETEQLDSKRKQPNWKQARENQMTTAKLQKKGKTPTNQPDSGWIKGTLSYSTNLIQNFSPKKKKQRNSRTCNVQAIKKSKYMYPSTNHAF